MSQTRYTYIISLPGGPPYIRHMADRHEEVETSAGSKELRLFDSDDNRVGTYIGYEWLFIIDSFGDWVAKLGHKQSCPKCGKLPIKAKPGMAAKSEYQLGDDDTPILICEHCRKRSRLNVDWKAQILDVPKKQKAADLDISSSPTTTFERSVRNTPPDIEPEDE